jgi:hypothetical protein
VFSNSVLILIHHYELDYYISIGPYVREALAYI